MALLYSRSHHGLAEPMSVSIMRRVPDNDANRMQAVEALRQGDVVAYPTDTLYGLGANALDAAAIAKVFAIKGREGTQGLPLLIADLADLDTVASGVPPEAYALAERFWPGPLTLVLRRHPDVPPAVSGGGETIAVRLPDHPSPVTLVRALGAPITGTSANRHNGPNPVTADEVASQVGEQVAMVLDGGPCPAAGPSTIVDLSQGPARVLRPGAVSIEALRGVIPVAEASGAATP